MSIARRAAAWTLNALAAVIILVAVLSLAARLALTQADLFRTETAEALGNLIGADVKMQRLQARLRGFAPQLILHGAELRDRDTGAPLLSLKELRVDFDLSASLREGGPRIDGVTLVGADLTLVRDPDGRVALQGLADLPQGNDPGANIFFLRRGRFSATDSSLTWIDERTAAPPLRLDVELLDLHNRGQQHRLRIEARPTRSRHGELTVLADLAGSPRHLGEWSGEAYLRWHGRDLARLLEGQLPAGLGVSSQHVTLESWNWLQRGRLRRAVARVAVDGLGARLAPGRTIEPVGALTGLARWHPVGPGWRLDLSGLSLAGFTLPAVEVAWAPLPRPTGGTVAPAEATAASPVAAEDADQGGAGPRAQRLEVRVQALPLQLLQRLAALAPAEVAARLQGLALSGQLEDLRAELTLSPGLAPDWQLAGGIDGLGIAQCERPAAGAGAARTGAAGGCAGRRTRLRGLDLLFEAGPGGGFVGLRGSGVGLDPRPALGGTLDATTLDGDVNWRIDDTGVIDLWSDTLRLDTPDIDTETRLRAQLYTFGASPLVELQSRLANGRPGNIDRLASYLPVAVIGDDLEQWLLRAIRAGTMTSGSASFAGRLRDFPAECGNPGFELVLNVAGGELDYWPPRPAAPDEPSDARARARLLGWPPLRDLDGTLHFKDRSLTIEVSGARLRDSRLTSGSAVIEDLWQPDKMTLRAQGAGPLSDGRWVLQHTPLSGELSGVADAIDVSGDATLELGLEIPLQAPSDGSAKPPFRFDGALLLDGTPTLTPTALPVQVTRLDGRLSFDNTGVTARDITGQVDGQALRLGVGTESAGDGSGGSTRIDIAGRSSVEYLARRFPAKLWELATGTAGWQVQLTLDNADLTRQAPPLRVELTSDLTGIALSPPAPIGKRADEPRPLRVTTAYTGDWPMDLSLDYGDLSALLRLDRPAGASAASLERAAVSLDAGPATLPDRHGIRFDGRVDTLDLAPWLAWIGKSDALLAPPAEARPALPVLPSRMRAGTLALGPLRLRDVDARFSPRDGPDSGGWSIGFDAENNGGSVDLPGTGGDGTVRVRLDALDIAPLTGPEPGPEPDPGPSGTDDAAAPADPASLGRLALTVESLRYGDSALGRLLLSTAPVADGVRFDELSLTGPLLHVRADGRWTRDTTGYQSTELKATARTTDFGELLRALDYYSEIQGAPADASLSLAWPGGPQGFSVARARGALQMDFGAGRLLDVNPGVGRMLGLVNLSALSKRLTLDFSDVFEPGFGFDSMTGRFNIGSGQARITRFELLSSTADIRITGITNLVERTFDQTVWVTPKVGTGVAIAGAVAGGPLLGAAVLLADKVSGGGVDRIGRQEYRVVGPWASPRIEHITPFSGNGASAGPPSGSSGAPPTGAPERKGAGSAPAAAPAAPDNPFLEGF